METGILETGAGTLAGRASRFALAALVYGLLVLTYAPWKFSLPGGGVEHSWHAAITYGALAGWQWGRDIVLPYGPLGFVLPSLWSDALLGRDVAINSILVIALAVGTFELLRDKSALIAGFLALVALLPMALLGRFSIYLALPLLAALGHFMRPAKPLRFEAAILAIAAGAFALIYIGSGVLALAIFLLIDSSRLRHRRVPAMVPLFLVASFSWWLLAGQQVATLGLFIRSNFEHMSGYGSNGSLAGPPLEIVGFLIASAIGLWLVAKAELGRLRDPVQRLDAFLLLGVLAVYWFVTFKRGFIRHDLHSVSAWLSLATAAATYVSARWKGIYSGRVRYGLIALSLATSMTGILVLEQAIRPFAVPLALERVFLLRPWGSLQQATRAVRDPALWLSEWREKQSTATAYLRASAPVPFVDGSVDILPNMQSSLIAQGLDYRPRPVFQDYTAATPWLVELNRVHYRNDRAARYMLFRPDTIDNRYPLLDQGPALSDLLANYDPRRIDGEFLVFERRLTPLHADEADTRVFSVNLGSWVALERRNAPLILRADIAYNIGGKLLGVALSPPILVLSVRLANGMEREYRLVPTMAKLGFLLSPLVESSIDLAAVATNSMAITAGNAVVEFKIDTASEFGRRFVETPMRVEVASWSIVAGQREPMPELRRILARRELATQMAAHTSTHSPRVEARGTEAFAHAPTSIALPVASASRLRASFGIQEAAFTGSGATDGVCFRVAITDRHDMQTPLAERCLDPRARAEDRRVQSLDLPIALTGHGTLLFETECRANCEWDWSFWKDVEVDP